MLAKNGDVGGYSGAVLSHATIMLHLEGFKMSYTSKKAQVKSLLQCLQVSISNFGCSFLHHLYFYSSTMSTVTVCFVALFEE